MSKAKEPKLAAKPGLIGKYFHTFKNDTLNWQGQIIDMPYPGYVLVELFEWMAGFANGGRLVRIEDLVGWNIYETAEEMNNQFRDHPSWMG